MEKYLIICLMLALAGCEEPKEISSIATVNWVSRQVELPLTDSLERGTSYLSVYSQIYSQTEHITHDLTATVSIRNTSRNDTVYLTSAAYYDTHGTFIRSYFEKTIYIQPLETVEIVIDEIDQDGGTGANFLFDWQIPTTASDPLFEAVMISTSGQQGLSFTTQGIRIE